MSSKSTDSARLRSTRDSADTASTQRPPDMVFIERLIACSAGQLFGVEAGEVGDPPILLIHGYPDTHDVWRPVMRLLARTHHVFAYDVRGAGASCRPQEVADYQMAHLADDIEAVATEVFGSRTYHLIGHDWGGIQSWEAVSRAATPSRVASFTSFSGPCLDHVAHWMRVEVRGGASRRNVVLRQMLSSLYIPVLQIPGLATFLWHFVLADRWRREHESDAATRFRTLEQDGSFGANLYRANVTDALIHPRDITSDVPTLLVGLARDPFVGTELMKASQGHLATSEYAELDEDHWSAFQDPESLCRLISAWVERHA